ARPDPRAAAVRRRVPRTGRHARRVGRRVVDARRPARTADRVARRDVGGVPAGCGAGAARRRRGGQLTMSTLPTARHYARIYRRLQAQYIKSRLQYRADFVVASLGMVVTAVVTIVLFWVLFRSVPDIAGWTFDELLFIYGFYLLTISPMQVLFDAMWSLRMDVTEGSFIKYYFRPLRSEE